MLSEISYPWFFFYRIARLTLLVFIPTLFIILFLYRSSYKDGLVSQMSIQIEQNLQTINRILSEDKLPYAQWCSKLDPSKAIRYTLAKKNGLILCDSIQEKTGEVVKDPTEITDAFETNFSTRVRFSDQFKTQSVFAGLKITDDLVLREIVPITSLKDDMNRFDRVLFLKIVPFAVVSYFLFLFFFYRATKPLGNILRKVNQFKEAIPFKRSLRLLYKQDEWANLEEALNEAETQLKQQIHNVKTENEKIAAILESIYDDIIAVDPYETVLFYNSNFKRNFMKVRRSHELMPKLWHTLSDEEILAAFRSVLKTGETIYLKGRKFSSSFNPDRYFDLTISSLKNTEGKVTGALGVFYDVTEFKLTEQMRVNFVANVSHEIRTPLTSVKGYTQMLQSQKNKIEPELHLFLDKIISNTERMIALFNDLLNLSVIEAKQMMKFDDLPLDEIIEAISENIITNYPEKKVVVERDTQLPTIKGDQRLIEQVLSNLIDNACKYSGPEIAIKVSTFSKNSKSYIMVSDNGPGISKEHLLRIFERFYRVDSSREESRGTGLGLSIVKHIIAKHGGRIWAESENQGTSFIIELPLA